MTRLDCNVTNCLHNAENCCCKAAIIVEGEQAKDTCDTCCGSFEYCHPFKIIGKAEDSHN